MVVVILEKRVLYFNNVFSRPKSVETNNITVVKRTFTNIKFKWNAVETNASNGEYTLTSNYLATIRIKNGQVHQESVLGLVCIQIIMFLYRR